jgi:hypothetical protein
MTLISTRAKRQMTSPAGRVGRLRRQATRTPDHRVNTQRAGASRRVRMWRRAVGRGRQTREFGDPVNP